MYIYIKIHVHTLNNNSFATHKICKKKSQFTLFKMTGRCFDEIINFKNKIPG